MLFRSAPAPGAGLTRVTPRPAPGPGHAISFQSGVGGEEGGGRASHVRWGGGRQGHVCVGAGAAEAAATAQACCAGLVDVGGSLALISCSVRKEVAPVA